MARRRKKHEEHENHERWLVSYADFITLLFAFFVVMYSVSAINEGKFRVLSDALVAAFRSQAKSIEPIQIGEPAKAPKSLDSREKIPARPMLVTPPVLPQPVQPSAANVPIRQGENMQKTQAGAPVSAQAQKQVQEQARKQAEAQAQARGLEKIAAKLESDLAELIKRDLIEVRRDKHSLWLEVEIKASILFSSGSATLEPAALPPLQRIAGVLRGHSYPIQVEGFTDNRPISTLAFPSNWELSAGRAASVVHLFMKSGVDPGRMAAIGFGEYRPATDNKTEEGRRKNRRVVLVILANPEAAREVDAERSEGAESSAVEPSRPARAAAAADAKPATGVSAQARAGGDGLQPPAGR